MDTPANSTSALKNDEYLVQAPAQAQKVLLHNQGWVTLGSDGEESYEILRGDPRSRQFVLLFRNRVYHVHAEPVDDKEDPGKIALTLNGKAWTGTVDDKRSMLAKRFGAGPGGRSGETIIKAPMPGMVLRILVKPGDEVQRDDGLIILEAMKMENEVRADHPGRVVRIECAEGKPVDKNAKLIIIHYEH